MAIRVLFRRAGVIIAAALIGAMTSAAPAPVAGIITTLAGTGTAGSTGDGAVATSALVNNPGGLAVDSSGNLYIADASNHRIRKVTVATGIITTVAGNGSAGSSGDGAAATSARLQGPTSVAIDASGNLFIADRANNRIRKVAAATGIISTVAGTGTAGYAGDGGPATAAQLRSPYGVGVDASGHLFIADYSNNAIRRVDATTGVITTVAGTGTFGFSGDAGAATAAQLGEPASVAVDTGGNLYIADYSNARVRKVTAATGVITTIAGTGATGFNGEAGPATSAKVDSPVAVALDGRGNLLIADQLNNRIRQVALSTGTITTVVGSGLGAFDGDTGAATAAAMLRPNGVVVDASGNIFVSDTGNHRVRKVTTPSIPARIMSTLAGTGTEGFSGDGGPGSSAQLAFPTGIAVDATGHVYLADSANARVRKIDAGTGVITTVAGTGARGSTGDGGQATTATVEPYTVAVDSAGNVYMADRVNRRIRKLTVATGIITTVAGTGVEGSSGDGGPATSATFVYPEGLAIDAAGHLYIADRSAWRIRRVDAVTGVITTVAGNGTFGFSGDGGAATSAQLTDPTGVAVDTAGNLYIADSDNHRIRKVTAATGIITTIAGTGTAGLSGESVPATAAKLNDPYDVAVDGAGNVYIADHPNHRIRMVDTSGIISTVVGSTTNSLSTDTGAYGGDGGAASAAQMRQPLRVAVDAQGSVYIADDVDHRVRKASNPPQFTTQPAGQSATTGQSVTFTCAATGSPSYQWQVSTDAGATWVDLSNGSPYSGVATGTLTVAPTATGQNGARYRCAATNPIATSHSTAAMLTVQALAAPTFATQPSSTAIAAGQTATFTAVASGVPTPALQWQVSTDGGTSFGNLSNAAPYSGVTTSTLTITSGAVGLNGARYRVVGSNSEGSVTSATAVLTVRGAMTVSPSALTFQATKAGASGALTAVSSPQPVTVTFAGAPSGWTASVAVPWLQLTSGSGSAAGQFTVGIINTLNEIGGSTLLTGDVTISSPTSPTVSATVPVTLRVTLDGSATAAPVGQVDTPVQNATGVQGAIGVTGWALDDIGVTGVKIYRNCLTFENQASCQIVLGYNVVEVGDAAFLAGARPDVEAAFSTYPQANRAGWGYLMLTPMLPHVTNTLAYGGQGPLTLYAVATDVEGNKKLLGRSSDPSSADFAVPTQITMANDSIAKPFGAIDTPGQGQTVSGVLNNFGWALTPDSNTTGGESGDILIATNGSTMTVFIDSLPVALVAYNQCRGNVGNPVPAATFCNDDVANIFGNPTPQAVLTARTSNPTLYRNLDATRAAIGVYSFNTATLSNGLHTIAWSVSDSAGRNEGIGSRFFNVLNSGADAARAKSQ